MELFVDMDGVLADFDKHYETLFGEKPVRPLKRGWKNVRAAKDFYRSIPPMEDVKLLWSYIKDYKPSILTGIAKAVEGSANNKREWAAEHFPGVPVICCLAEHKYLYATKDAVLIDDWEKYKTLWEGAGGTWITHVNALDTIAALGKLGL